MKKFILLILFILLTVLSVMIIDEQREVFRLKKVIPSFSSTLPAVRISSDDAVFEFHPYDNEAAKKFLAQLPLKMIMTRWGDGGYSGSLPKKIDADPMQENTRRAFFKGEVVLHQTGRTVFLMFGATPVVFFADYPMLLSSGGIPLGQLKDYSGLEHLTGVSEFVFEVKK